MQNVERVDVRSSLVCCAMPATDLLSGDLSCWVDTDDDYCRRFDLEASRLH